MSAANFARSYCRKYGMHIVPIPPGEKFPSAKNWGNTAMSDADAAFRFYEGNPTWNMGVALGPSRLCSFDVDNLEAAQIICEEFGWALEPLRTQYPTIQGQAPGFRVMFRVPDDVELRYHKLQWPRQDEPGKHFAVWELRAADTEQRQDVLPPSIHPKTGKPYVWLTRPNGTFPEPPDWLLKLWQNWKALEPQLQAVCPWAPKQQPRPPRPPRQHTSESVIDAFDAAHDLEACLTRYGYKQQGKRWLSPHSGTGLPGVVILDDTRCWIHHASDPLCSDASRQPVAPFDLFCYYDHGGDIKKATRAAAEILGMDRKPPPPPAPAAIAPPAPRQQPKNLPVEQPADARMLTFPHTTGRNHKPLQTIENLQAVCDFLGVTVRYNVITKEEEILVPGAGFSRDNRANASLAWLTSKCEELGMPTGKVGDYVTYLADSNQYNPVAEWITSKPWDGQSRLQDLFDTVVVAGDAGAERLKQVFMRRWLISAVAAAFQPDGVSAHGVLVFQGEQYLGKTKWFKSLVPAALGVVADGKLLRPDDRDSVKQIVSNWLVELGELDATFRKADIAQLKSFLTKDRDVLRRAYARRESEFARRTVFFASVNAKEFLHDPTGNRRYWTVECKSIDHDHGIDMQQLWAEVLTLYQAGESWFLSGDEFTGLNEQNKSFEVIDPIEELISSWLEWSDPPAVWRWSSATDVLRELGFERPSVSDSTKAALFIRARNGGVSKRTGQARLMHVPLMRSKR